MKRTISVSTDVFAAIWAARANDEGNEDEILSRILGCAKDELKSPAPANENGVHDSRNNVDFPGGFEIFRTYKQREYRAVARNGAWERTDNGKRYPTLNQLNSSIATGAENVWNGNWKFKAEDGKNRSINELRS